MSPFSFLALAPAHVRVPVGIWGLGTGLVRFLLWAIFEQQGVELPSYTNEAVLVLGGFVAFFIGARMYLNTAPD